MEKLEEWNENTGITWWTEARKKLNKIIRKYNKWIVNDTMDIKRTSKLLTKINLDLCKDYSNQDGGSGYKKELAGMHYNVRLQLKNIT
ncbi:MAG: hypothetical protein ACJAVA_000264 [Flavobacteriaceae bacterium]|jgi:hypothetical protein